MATDLTGLLLAGGRSRRFGSDKALAEIDGVSLIARSYAALAPLCTEVLVGVGPDERVYPLPGPARIVTDGVPDAGPLAGLAAGLAALRTPWLLVIACDLPFVTLGVLRSVAEARRGDLDAVVGSTPDGRSQPLCACYSHSVLPAIRSQLENGDYALYKLLTRLRTATVPVPHDALRNINTPGDLASGARD